MNELIVVFQSLLVGFFALFCLRLGKSALTSYICIVILCANIFVLQQIDFFSFTITSSDAFAVGAVIGLNLLQEYHGKELAKKAINYSFVFGLFFLGASQVHLLFTPSVFDTTHSSYMTLFSHTPRIIISSFLVFYLVQKIDVKIFSKIKERFVSFPLSIRIFMSVFCSQLLDTVLFSCFALYGIVENIFDIIVVSFSIKLFITVVSAPITSFSKYWVKKNVTI